MSRPTLVAITTLSRRPPCLSHLPITVSDSPPVWPGAQREKTSAVSMKLKPASSHASSSENDVASSAVQPNTLPPKHSGETCRAERPRVRYCMASSSSQFKKAHHDFVRIARAGAHEHALVNPAQRLRDGFETRAAAKVDRGRIDSLAPHQPRHQLRRPGADRAVLHVDQVAAVGLQHIARVELRQRIAHDELEVRPARQHARAPAVAHGFTGEDRNQPAQAARGAPDFQRFGNLYRQVGEELEFGGGEVREGHAGVSVMSWRQGARLLTGCPVCGLIYCGRLNDEWQKPFRFEHLRCSVRRYIRQWPDCSARSAAYVRPILM